VADVFRFRYGDTNPAFGPFKTGVVVSVGDLCYQDSTDGFTIKPVSQYPWAGSLGATQAAVIPYFCGVADQRYDGSATPGIGVKDGNVRYSTEGVFEFACAANSTFNAGDLVGPDQAGGGVGNMLAQQVVAVTVKANAVGRVERGVVGASSVKVRVFTTRLGVVNN
jgi:hypothetical protein